VTETSSNRRSFLRTSAALGAAALSAMATPALASTTPAKAATRRLQFVNLHTGERLEAAYWSRGSYVQDSLKRFAWVLRDHRSGETHAMDPKLFDLLHQLQRRIGTQAPFEVISGYRSPATNAQLRSGSSGVAKNSLHMQGRAIDIRVPDRPLAQLHEAALALELGGVGLYTRSNFVHVDTGDVRHWGG